MEFFNVLSVEDGRQKLLDTFKNYDFGVEEVNILDSLDRILAEDIVSEINVPEFNRSTVDGYAIKSSDSHGATDSIPSFLNLIGEILMGERTNLKINSGEGVYVPTGGMIPDGADAVAMIENCERLDDKTLVVYKPLTHGENIIHKGDDITEGYRILEKGKRISPNDIGVLASIGILRVKVYNKPKFYVISTGDELIDLGEELTVGKVRDINGYALHGLISKLGGIVVNKTIVKDNFELLKDEIRKGIEESDIVLISGGSSVGTRDFTYDSINSFDGKGVFVHGISIKPGKPTIIGEARGKAVFGLPGHPVSSIIIFKVFVECLVKSLMTIKEGYNKTRAIIDFNFHSSPGKETYQMVKLIEKGNKLYAVPEFGRSGMITLLSKSSGYIIIGAHEEGVNKGEERYVYFI